MSADARLYEYGSAAAVVLPTQPARAFPSALHEGPTSAVIPLDLSAELGHTPWPATSPNLLASFIHILAGEEITTRARATAQLFYVIRGRGTTTTSGGLEVAWAEGGVLSLPACDEDASCVHRCSEDSALYHVHDEPLLRYLGVRPAPDAALLTPVSYPREMLRAAVEELRHAPDAASRNRCGVLLGHAATEGETKTLSRVLWALLNTLPPRSAQRPHRHNSVALDLAVEATPGLVYTLMGPTLGEDGWVKEPLRMDWSPGAVFTTPPGWWHSHHNDSDVTAWVLPVQDAGLYTRQRTLDIQFAPPV